MRRPGCEPDEIEGRAQTLVRIGEALSVDGGGAQEDFATQWFAAQGGVQQWSSRSGSMGSIGSLR